MAGRTEARVFTSIWKDKHFRALSWGTQWLFFTLISQPSMAHCGVIPLRPSRWALLAPDLTVERVEAAIEEAIETRFAIADHETGELLVRSLMRRDKVLRQPFMIGSVTDGIHDIESVRIASAVLAEMVRIRDEGDVNKGIAQAVDQLIRDLETHLDTHPDTHPDSDAGWDSDTHPDTHTDTHPDTDPGRQLGEGGGYCSSEGIPLSPNPLPPGSSDREPEPAGPPAAGVTAEGEGADQDKPNTDLAVEVREIRPDWSTRSIIRALQDPAVAERPADLVAAAALALARDPDSKHPGRLAHDGPWWHQRAGPARAAPAMPRWCGECDEIDRTVEVPGGIAKCPNCHPASQNGVRR
jgi:hypothetical protein